ncbi:GrpB family protein [Escherichia coli]|uniref:GrpB family protein n=1 Tax=Escherichia coli TaxID=562 RepID=UPI00203A485C|nr:GrpB family protein [Escherichia coli]
MKIEIMEYNPDWTKNFEEEKIKLLHFFGSHAVAIEHIGSYGDTQSTGETGYRYIYWRFAFC